MRMSDILPRFHRDESGIGDSGGGAAGRGGSSSTTLPSHNTDTDTDTASHVRISLSSHDGGGASSSSSGSSISNKNSGGSIVLVSDGIADNSNSVTTTTSLNIIASDTNREQYLSVSSSSSSSSISDSSTGLISSGAQVDVSSRFDYKYNNYNSDSATTGNFIDVADESINTEGISGGGISTNNNNNRTLSDVFSLVGNGGVSVSSNTNDPGGSNNDGDSGDTSSIFGYHLGLDKFVNNHNVNSYNGVGASVSGSDIGDSGFDYNYNYNYNYNSNDNNNGHVLFDNGFDYIHGNVSFSDLDSFSLQLLNQIEFKMAQDLTRYVCPAIIVLGNISNFVAFLVLRRKKFKHSSVAFYMRAYALANLCFLDLMMGIAWLCSILEIQYLAHRTDWSCRLWTFISNVITYSGIWFVVVMSIDRFVYINLPSKASGYCRLFTAKGITTFVIICLIVVSIHAMWTFELQPQGCWVSHNKDDLHKLTWPWWSAALYSYIPLLLLLFQIIAQSVSYCVRLFLKQPHSPPDARQNGDQDTFVKPVFVITVAFFFFTIPSIAINLLDIHLPSNLLRVDVIAKIELTKKITELLSTFNNSLLGIVLLALSPSYRKELLGLCRTIFCCARSRTLKVFEMRTISQSDDSSPHVQVDYELCNNNEENLATDV